MSSQAQSGLPPSLIVSSHDLARLEALLESPALQQHPAALALGEELGRATVLAPEQIPADIVAMHSRVECEDELQGERHQLTLVYPHEADAAQDRVSVLAPVGSALLGLAVGQSIDWQAPGGRPLRLRVIAVQAADAAARATR
ncbi:nucleoside diphosphate kinase regulator [Xanthomonas translucens pv. arrhenatheri]|uniref:Regulator of nucleoside diphosphate kinase n=1 Tax=Xanthomonas graminis pv. arrhenatheri LMG 727 TaxID=1195923 RepID=A0A0K3A6B3_9XANT|nr:nucleoside diphosphate kinase regulator [Xanthomonas translucens]OAX66004.1 nucleoside diphosphate kinase regulator [Xanthomonas translucens pv. arrhenatheri]UKE76940.1 nucleoside diphosphate kinase regulator [Xanthomonas translucens pv. arrhenatheri]CTP90985.1 regulator of nucleoside diphosphate kinase [Xanthomonas translucens pv. arrhenatheri LMG 727]